MGEIIRGGGEGGRGALSSNGSGTQILRKLGLLPKVGRSFAGICAPLPLLLYEKFSFANNDPVL